MAKPTPALAAREAFVFKLLGCIECEAYGEGNEDMRPHKVMEHDGSGPHGTAAPAVWHGHGEECGECEEEFRVLEAEKLGLIRPLEVWKPARPCSCGVSGYGKPGARWDCFDCGAPVEVPLA